MKVRIRKLKNDKWVGEVKGLFVWRGVDATNPRMAWVPGHAYYTDCWCDSEEEANQALRNYCAAQGF